MPGLDDVILHYVDTVDKAAELMRWASNKDRLAFDTETTGLDTQRDRVRLVQVGDERHGWAIPWEGWGGVFKELVSKFTGRWTAHNLPFDYMMLENAGVTMPWDRCDDTRLACHVLEPTMSTALKNQARRHVDRRAGMLQTELDESLRSRDGWTWATVPCDFQPYWSYAALDVVITHQLQDVLEPRLDALNCRRAYDLELAASWVTSRMTRNGFLVDRPYAERALAQFRQMANQLTEWCLATYGCKPSQNASIAEALIAAGVPLDAKTKTGAYQLDKEVLGGVDHDLARTVLRHRQVTKLASTYLENFLELTSEADPRLHARINVVGARTGRMSMDSPSLQNLPRRDDANPEATTIRNCLVAGEDRTLVMSDSDQIEMRILAHLASDPAMIAAFNHVDDFFTVLTRQIFNDDAIVKADPRRQTTKNAGYAKIYGAGPAKFGVTAGISYERAVDIMNRFDQLYPGVRQLQNAIESRARERYQTEGVAYVVSPLTGRRHPADDDRLYTLVNYEIQGMAAEIFKMKLVELDAAGLGDHLVCPVHDEVILDVPNDVLNDACTTVRDVMNDAELLRVPVSAGVTTARRWGEAEK